MGGRRITLGIISHQRIARSMAGPGIRCWEIARALAADADVILFTPEDSDLKPEGFEIVTYSGEGIVAAVAGCDAILCQGFILNNYPALQSLGKFLIVDLYVPMSFEALGQYEDKSVAEQTAIQESIMGALMEQLLAGHFFICASERQRDFWLGMLAAAGRILPAGYLEDKTLHALIDTVPFGIADEPPVATGAGIRGAHPAVGESERLLLWGGGIYNWLDPFTPIRAMELLKRERDDVRLLFLGARQPDPNVPAMRAYDEAVALSRELGLLDEYVIFNDQWVRYEDRVNYLLEADLGIFANLDNIETRFSFRTRVLDCIWASLPMAATDGDCLSAMIGRRELGLVAPRGDAAALAAAIARLLDDKELYGRCRENLGAVADEFRWSQATSCLKRLVAGDLKERVLAPRADMLSLGARLRDAARDGSLRQPPAPAWRRCLRLLARAARRAGLR